MSAVQHLITAISLRNEVKKGIVDKEWVTERVIQAAREGCFSDSQIASIIGWSRAWVSRVVRESGARRGQEPIPGGTLDSASLDTLLALTGPLTDEQQANLLQAVIAAGTGTRLISRLTGISLGTVLYQQRKMKEK